MQLWKVLDTPSSEAFLREEQSWHGLFIRVERVHAYHMMEVQSLQAQHRLCVWSWHAVT